MTGLCVVEENSWQGCWQMHRQIMVVPLHMCSAFPTERGGADDHDVIFSDVTTFACAFGRGVY